MQNFIRKFDEVLADRTTFTLTTHVNPDGDGVGSELALYRFLQAQGKSVRIINNNHIPEVYRFLEYHDGLFETYNGTQEEWIKESDAIIILDVSDIERLGGMQKAVDRSDAFKISIDHHVEHQEFADLNLTDEEACATGEIVFKIIQDSMISISKSVAEALYVTILTDTASFSNSHTTPNTFKIAARLVELGANPKHIYQNIFEKNSLQRVTLFQKALATLEYDCDGKLAWISIDKDMVASSGAMREEMDGFVEYTLTIIGVRMGLLFLEVPEKGTKVSIRSKGGIDSHAFAKMFGGGGHAHAAGIRKAGQDLEAVKETILKEARKIFS